MIISFTGHRPDKLPDKETGYKLPNPTYNYVCQEIEKALLEMKPEKVITGMALGADQYCAHICIKLGIPFVAAIPFLGQERMWPAESKRIYKIILGRAIETIVVCEGGYAPFKMQKRNEWMVDHSDKLIAVWNKIPSSGTSNCVNYATKIGKEVYIINPLDVCKVEK